MRTFFSMKWKRMHIIIDNPIPRSLLRSASASWPDTGWTGWHRYRGTTADKYGSLHASILPEACRAVVYQLALAVSELIGDSFVDYDLHAAGLHQIPPGGFLGRHLDAEFHPLRPWKRTHSIVLFLDDFEEHHGGELFLEPNIVIRPAFNRVAVFETENCWHQVRRTSLDAPMRRTIALFAWNFVPEKTGELSARFVDA